uniref:Tumor protein p63 regulated 1 n=1 Tax=Seriola lalandi dorsalis TaxID=1841481 RepID=A0A3B4YX42_SERLL
MTEAEAEVEAAPTEEQQLRPSSSGPEDTQPAARTEPTEERAAEGGAARFEQHDAVPEETSLDQFRLKKFFVLRPGTLNQAIKDVEALVDKEVDGSIHSIWLMAEREGEGLRVFWDRLREPSFISRWNPFATDFPFITFTYHPVRNISDTFATLCDIQNFREKLKDAAQKVHVMKPVPGKANGVLVLNQPIHVEAYVGLMSFLGNQNKLGYSFARGNIGF